MPENENKAQSNSSDSPQEQLKTLKIINEVYKIFQKDKEKFLVFRGLPNINYALESAAARRFRNNNERSQLDFINYHKVLLDEIKTGHYKGINNEDLAQMSELELLAQVQHLGGATCLTDFSLNLLVSLWFATSPKSSDDKSVNTGDQKAKDEKAANDRKREENYEKNSIEGDEEAHGALYIINLNSEQNREKFLDVMTLKEREKTSVEDILTYRCEERVSDEHFWYWKPRKTNGRVNNQSSIFIFGLPEVEDSYFEIVPIHKNDKADIRRELKTYFGLDVKTIFPDLHGFSLTANSHTSKLYKKFNQNCLDIARDYLHSKDYNACLNHLNEIKECESADGSICKRHISTQKCDWTYERKYLEAMCQNMKARDEYEKKQSNDDKKMGHISYDYLVSCQEKAVSQLYEAMNSQNKRIKLNCVMALVKCFYDIVICDEDYLEKDYAIKNERSEFIKLINKADNYIEEQNEKINIPEKTVKEDFVLSIERKYQIYFSLLELSIFAKAKDIYLDYRTHIKKLLEEKNYLNAGFLLDFFDIIAETVLNISPSDLVDENKKVNEQVKSTKKQKKIKKQFEWEFETIQHSLDRLKEKANINNEKLNKLLDDIEAEILNSSTPSREHIGNEVNRIERDAEDSMTNVESEHKNGKQDKNHKDIFAFTLKWDYEDMKHWLKNEYGDNTSLTILCNEMKRMQDSWMYRMFETAHTFKHEESQKVKNVKEEIDPKDKDKDHIPASISKKAQTVTPSGN